ETGVVLFGVVDVLPALLFVALLVFMDFVLTCVSVEVLTLSELGFVCIVLDPFTGVLLPLDAFGLFTVFVENCCLSWVVPLFGSRGGTGLTFPFRFPPLIPLYIPTPPAPALPAAFPPVLTTFPAPLPAVEAPSPATSVLASAPFMACHPERITASSTNFV